MPLSQGIQPAEIVDYNLNSGRDPGMYVPVFCFKLKCLFIALHLLTAEQKVRILVGNWVTIIPMYLENGGTLVLSDTFYAEELSLSYKLTCIWNPSGDDSIWEQDR